MKKISVKNFNLKYTIECGQFFRYRLLNDGSYLINYLDKLFVVKQIKDDEIEFSKNVDEKFISNFFRLDDDLGEIYSVISTDEYMKQAISEYHGLRLIRQNPWECMVSYVCSSASNIPKIQKNLELLSGFFGKPVTCKNYDSFSFPEIGSMDDFEKILSSKTGYRAKFLYEVNKRVSDSYFLKLMKLSYETMKSELVLLPGIGEKIADCIILFSLDKLEAFPMDTWIKKALEDIYGLEIKNYKKAQEFAKEKWGRYAGYAQQYIYMKYRSDSLKK
ncbi:hypothetical protein BVX95_01610 [archaeon D22]|nr:hypothetical protein BVX95_01610 [archaeon D22]